MAKGIYFKVSQACQSVYEVIDDSEERITIEGWTWHAKATKANLQAINSDDSQGEE